MENRFVLILVLMEMFLFVQCKQSVKFAELQRIPKEPVHQNVQSEAQPAVQPDVIETPEPVLAIDPVVESDPEPAPEQIQPARVAPLPPEVKIEEPQVAPPKVVEVKSCEPEISLSASNTEGVSVLTVPNSCATEVTIEEKKNRTVDIIFLMDVSASMQSNIDAIRDNLTTFIGRLSNFNPRFGLVPFVDDIQTTNVITLTDDLDLFLAGLDQLKASGGGVYDYQEAGLLAVETGIALFLADLKTMPERGESDKIMLMVTNAPSHGGDSSSLSIDRTVELLNSFISQVKWFQLFYSIPTLDNVVQDPTSGIFVAAHRQYEDLNRLTNLAVSEENRGGLLSYPLSAETLLVEFFNELSRTIPRTVPGQCVIFDSDFVHTITGMTQHAGVKLGQSLDYLQVNKDQIELVVSEKTPFVLYQWFLELSRCCGQVGDLSNFTCQKMTTQVIRVTP